MNESTKRNYLIQLLNRTYSRYRSAQKSRAVKRLIADVRPEVAEADIRILVWTAPGGMESIIEFEAMLATALTIRGVDIRFVVCDGSPTACIMRLLDICSNPQQWHDSCPGCEQKAVNVLDTYGFKYYKKGDYLTGEQKISIGTLADENNRKKICSTQYQGINIGQLALASTVRYSKGNHIENFDEVLQKYCTAGFVNFFSAEGILNDFNPHKLLMSHGTYVDWGVPFKLAVKKGIPVVVWNSAFEMRHFFFRTETDDFSNNRLQRISNTFWQKHKNDDLTDFQINRLKAYFNRRYRVGADDADPNKNAKRKRIVGMHQFDTSILKPSSSHWDVIEKYKLNIDKPVWAIFTHVVWEGLYNYGPILYQDESTWLIETINNISRFTDTEWLIRIHPGELQYQNSKSALEIIHSNFDELPENVKIIAPTDKVNTVDILPIINGGITIFGTVGLELAVQGKPVILCGRGYYGDKGFTYDCDSESEYIELLAKAHCINRLTEKQIKLARNYAYTYFLKSQIPIECLKKNHKRTRWHLDLDKINLLKPHRDKYIDIICKAIIKGGDFLLETPESL